MLWIMAIPYGGTLGDLSIMWSHDQIHSRGTLRMWGLAFQEETDENHCGNQ